MKIWTLLENTACREDLAAEHGLSLYIETSSHKILFDAGQTDTFYTNSEKMGVDLKAVDFAVLSHGHYDHSGGLCCFLEQNDFAPVYISPRAFGDFYNSKGKYIGVSPALAQNSRLHPVENMLTIDHGITLYPWGDAVPVYPVDSAGLTILENGVHQPDKFLHEQYLLIEEEGQRILISGCSHRGILNIVDRFRPDVLVGGFHFMKMDPDGEAIATAAEQLLSYPTTYITGHCTGSGQFERMKAIMGDRLFALSGGAIFDIQNKKVHP